MWYGSMQTEVHSGHKSPEPTEESPTCPQCGREITAVSTMGPGRHSVEPCGHGVATLTLRQFSGVRK
ncbi:hypothetical protein SAMN06269185_1045 [Natronoarchaeum philippinense]|uniref:Uncharacterized protein n=1 Tax=Natronoarchaeum philippinense TaxID=558529 RepID=A0A285N9B4_NATPI|nr:hypothetical protein [Natronoarchaeum philippinense]SNZ06094.1 hypothetical protein SAMN06269185_1045 [Natronoarchaeum philippinense]